MSIITDKIKSAEYIYSTHTKWGLKKYTCNVLYYTEEPLDDLCYVICSILNSTEDGHYFKRDLGILLGFSVADRIVDDKHEAYFDIAELKMFEELLSRVAQERLIRIQDYDIYITELGRISVKEGRHYQFFAGTQDVYEHATLKSKTPTAMLMFPFYKDMGICSQLVKKNQIWPEDKDIQAIIYGKSDQLKKRLELVSKESAHIYGAKQDKYFDFITEKVPVRLYQHKKEYIPVVMKGDTLAPKATELINEELNSSTKENIVLECLFQKLWDDRNAVLDYNALEPYMDLVDYEELTKDSRTKWDDPSLFGVIVKRATATCWRNISRNCDLKVLYSHIDDYKEKLDWPILTSRVDDTFLIDNFASYPWDLEIIAENRDISVVEKLLLVKRQSVEEWDWSILEQRLSSDFVLSHLDIVDVDLSKYTEDTNAVREAILSYLDKKWHWKKVEEKFALDFIYNHIVEIGEHIGFVLLFDRVFADKEWAEKFVKNDAFRQVLESESKEGGKLSSAIFNDKKYLWNDDVIDLFLSNGLICWESTPYMKGFEYNPTLVWSKTLFDKYSVFITSDEGKSYVSSKIDDISIISENPSFGWDWNAISRNQLLLSDPCLYSSFGKKLNWANVCEANQNISILESVDNIDALIGQDSQAWGKFSEVADIEYVITTYKNFQYPWDWSVLTPRMFQKLKLENIGNKLFVDKWDWDYLSANVSIDFLLSKLSEYKNYWNWRICLPRILNKENRLNLDFLDKLAETLTNITGSDKCEAAWLALTSQYTFKELKSLIKATASKKVYWWNMKYFCQHPDFNVFADLRDCRDFVDWDILSSSGAIDQNLSYNPKLGIKGAAWQKEVRDLLSDSNNHWNYLLLSHFNSLKNSRWFITQYKDKIDWDFISKESCIFCENNKQKLNEIVEEYKDRINFNLLSERSDVDVLQIIKINPKGDYDYNNLIERKVIKATLRLVEEKPKYPWNWKTVSSSKTFFPSADFLLKHIKCDFDWSAISRQDNQSAWSDEDLVQSVGSNNSICDQIDWYYLSSQDFFPLTKSTLEKIPLDKLNWECISARKEIISLIADYINYIDWSALSANKAFRVSNIKVLEKYKDNLDWSVVCARDNFVINNTIVDRFADYLDWKKVSASTEIDFSKAFVEKYLDKWNWPVLVRNKAFYNKIDISTLPYGRQQNIIKFINHFPCHPNAYHFTHMDNAIKIIRAMKLQSRNYAQGKFSNSAGSNVYRRNDAHRFARFYFAPKSPTQFYNEFLGKDKDDYKYYLRALRLGLPKCPLPVFFIFDVEELLSAMPDKCYYSTGNMQKDSSRYYKVIENPNMIKAREIYINSSDTFDERQQEFLVEGELDFSKLNNVQICCYNEDQARLLQKEILGTRWENRISIRPELYDRQNKELYFHETSESIYISTMYKNPFEFKVKYLGPEIPEIQNKNDVVRQRDNNIFVLSHVNIKKNSNFEVYFEVHEPREGSWLIYRNICHGK
jgi:hypothetical protein